MRTPEHNQLPAAAGPACPELPLARIIALAPDAIILLDTEQRILLFNSGAARIFGYSPDEALGQPLDLLLPEHCAAVHRASVRDFAAAAESARPTLMGTQRRVLGRRRDGGEFPAEATIIKLIEGEQLFFAAIVRDISARCRDEEARCKADEALRHAAGENARLLAEVHTGREQLQELSHRLIEAQEAERRTIAAELHDQIGQALTIVKMSLQAIPGADSDPNLSPYLAESAGAVERALQQVRSLSLDLRPPMLDDLGLVAALRWYAARQARLAGFSLHLQADPALGRLPPMLATACFRIAQEALTNIARHAQARQVWVELGWGKGRLQLSIRDDGRGFDARTAQDRASRGASLGLLGMRERVLIAGGQLSIDSTPGDGTRIQADFPLAALPAINDEG